MSDLAKLGKVRCGTFWSGIIAKVFSLKLPVLNLQGAAPDGCPVTFSPTVTGQPSGAAPCKLRTGSFRENTLAIIPDQKVPQRTLPNFAKSDILCHHGDGSDIVV